MNKIYFFIYFLLILNSISFSQGEIDTEHKILFRNEKSYALTVNTNGYGFGYRYGKRINIHKKFLYEGDFNIVKHSKEKKISSPYSISLFSFVYGKTNSAFNLRFGVGMHHEIYKKFDRNSVSIRYFYIGGITAMFLKPIYYEIIADSSNIPKVMRFEKNTPWWFISDKKNYFYGIDEMQIIPGGFVKTGFAFEFSKNDKRVRMLEAGIAFEAYPKPIKIMEIEKSQLFFPTLYISYRFGKAESSYYLKEQDEGTF